MGGRGASSGLSKNGNSYGSQYETIYQEGNIKFVKKKSRDAETLMETMTPDRIYVSVGGDSLLSITYFDKSNRRNKVIDLRHSHKGMQPHTHHGYEHNEQDSEIGASHLTMEEKIMVEKVYKIWYSFLNRTMV